MSKKSIKRGGTVKEIEVVTAFPDDVKNSPEPEEVLKKFSEIYDAWDRPEGDDLDQNIMTMMLDVAQFYEVKVFEASDKSYVFYPLEFDEEEVKSAISSLE